MVKLLIMTIMGMLTTQNTTIYNIMTTMTEQTTTKIWKVGAVNESAALSCSSGPIRMKSLNCNGGIHGRGPKSKNKQPRLQTILLNDGMPDVCLLQHTGVNSLQDAKRVTRLFGVNAAASPRWHTVRLQYRQRVDECLWVR
eukprot:SAG31_NODE_6522_length_1988_cov_8.834833_2_plen_141_part_00